VNAVLTCSVAAAAAARALMHDPHAAPHSPPVTPPIPDAWYLTGPTASGKTQVGLALARRLGGEILSLDSMAVYRVMDIGTAKPSAADRAAVPHHLLDLVDPPDEFSVAQYVDAAHAMVKTIRDQQREPIFVGGTPLYLKSLLRGIFQGPPADWEFRRQIEEEVERVGTEKLRERLWQVDPLSASKLHVNDTRRMIRALEVARLTGQPLSHWQTQFDEGRPALERKVFVLHWPREVLHERIDARVEQMFAQGLVEETQRLLAMFQALGRTAAQAVGYREVIEHLAGVHTLEQAKQFVKQRTHQFARRQETWFRSLSECRWVEMRPEESAEDVADRILEEAKK
jgi:tRNA dimethylallyltransferase